MPDPVLYVFGSNDGYFYIGWAEDVHRAFTEMRAGIGSQWIRLHRPSTIVRVIEDAEGYHETQLLFEYFKTYGVEKVRGSLYPESVLTPAQLANIRDALSNADESLLESAMKNMVIN